MKLPLEASLEGRFVRRWKRFFAEIRSGDDRLLTVHCPNPGSMRGCDVPGARVRCSTSHDPRRRLAHTLEMMRVGRAWVGLHTTRANALVAAALAAGALPELAGYAEQRREVAAGDGSRLDFRLDAHARDPRPAWLEVKSATMADGDRALFPDARTERGRRHLETLVRLHASGARTVLLFVVQRADCDRVAPADAIDPAYGRALREAAARGVEVRAVGAHVSPRAITLRHALPVEL